MARLKKTFALQHPFSKTWMRRTNLGLAGVAAVLFAVFGSWGFLALGAAFAAMALLWPSTQTMKKLKAQESKALPPGQD